MPERLTLDHSPEAPSQARRSVDGWLAEALTRRQLEDVKLLVSELVTNAIRHPQSRGGIVLEVALQRTRVRVVVTDPGTGFRKPGRLGAPAPDAIGGRGLLIVDRVASRWGVTPGRRTQVWFELDR